MAMDSLKSCACDIINVLREDIVELEHPENRKLLERFILPDSSGRTDNLFTRRTPLTFSLLLNFIMRHNPLSTQISLNEFFDDIGHRPVTKSALSQKRTRLDPNVFVYLNRKFVHNCYNRMMAGMSQWHGWNLLACDGSNIALPDTDSIAEYFNRHRYSTNTGKAGETFPMAKVLMIYDVLNGITLCGSLNRDTDDERKMLMDLLPEMLCMLPFETSRTICIMDRGYFSLKIIDDMDKTGMKFVVRVQLSSSVVKNFISSGSRECVVEWKPSNYTSLTTDPKWKASGRESLRVRLVRVCLPDGQVEVLATNLSSEEVPASKMKELYFMRWPIEVEYLHYKHAFVIEAFSGGRPICVRQDFFATILAHNMVRLMTVISRDEVERENRHKKLDYKSNMAILVGMFYAMFIEMMVLDEVYRCIDILYDTACKALTPVRDGRKFKRKRKKHKSSDKNITRTNRKRVN